MLEAGILQEGAPCELIDGFLVNKDRAGREDALMTHGKKHAYCIRLLQRLAPKIESMEFALQTQLPIEISSTYLPEPDGAVLRGSITDYRDRIPAAADVVLVIEVADHSLDHDRRNKLKIYAAANIPTYWVVNIPERKVEVYQAPVPASGEYARSATFGEGEMIPMDLGKLRSLTISASEVLG